MKRRMIGPAVIVAVLSLGFGCSQHSGAGRYAMTGDGDAVVFLDTQEGDVWIWRNPDGSFAGRGEQLIYRGRLPRGVRPMQIVEFFGDQPVQAASPPANEDSGDSEESKSALERLKARVRQETQALAH